MAVGDRTADSKIWFPGETHGYDSQGADTTSLPTDSILPTFGAGAPSGVPTGGGLYVDSANHKLYAYDGAAWIRVSGFNT